MRKIKLFFLGLFNKFQKLILQYVHPAILVVEQLKNFVNSPVIPLLETIIPGNLDNIIIEDLKIILPKVLKYLGLFDGCVTATTTPDQFLQCVIPKIAAMTPQAQASVYHSIASALTVELTGKKISWSDAVMIVEKEYQDIKTALSKSNAKP